MPRHTKNENESDDDGEAWGSDEDSIGEPLDEDDEPTIACPYCKRQIHEDSQRCPYCEQYISEEDAPRSQKPWWFIVGTIVCLYLVYRWIVG